MLSYDLVSSGGVVVSQLQISPYIAVLSESLIFPATSAFTDAGFIGVGIQIGRYFDDFHNKRSQYLNPNIRNQVEWAKKNDIPFGLIGHINARTETEAQEEFRRLYPVLTTFPPNLGVWFKININSTKKQIESIIEWYQKMLINRGFRYQIGFYNTKEELEKFNWQKFCNSRAGNDTEYKDFDRTSVSNYFANDWNLWWLDEPTEDEAKALDNLLTPSFFKLIPAGTSTSNLAPEVPPNY